MTSRMLSAPRSKLFFLTLIAIVFTASLTAQSAGTGALTGTVSDPSGGVVPNVSVTLTNTDTNQARTATTGADGGYKFALLPPGTYRIRFSAAGFKTAEVLGGNGQRDRDSRSGPDAGGRRAERTSYSRRPSGSFADRDFHVGKYGGEPHRDRPSAEQPQLYADPRTCRQEPIPAPTTPPPWAKARRT